MVFVGLHFHTTVQQYLSLPEIHKKMKCFKCYKVFSNEDEVYDHLKIDHGISGNKYFNCLQCKLPFEELSVFKEHVKNCKGVSLNNLHTESDG